MANKNNNKGYVTGGGGFATVEAYKLARTNISLSIIKQGCKRVLITSSVAGEGKTTTACNIAAAFSKQVNSRTIIIDCDLRKPTVSKFFRLKSAKGLTNYLVGMCTLDEIIQTVPGTELSVISSGIIPPNPSELLSSQAFADMLDELSLRFDYIIIDTPPVNIVVDAIPVIQLVDGVVLVAYQNKSTFTELDKAVDSVKQHYGKLIGIVLNGKRFKSKKTQYKPYRQQ